MLAAVATAVGMVVALRAPESQRRWALAWAAMTAATLVWAGLEQRELRAVQANWPAYRARLARDGASRLAGTVESTVRDLHAIARAALRDLAPGERPHAGGGDGLFTRLDALTAAPEERAIILLEADTVLAWGGRARVLPPQLAPVGVAASAFYLAVYVTETEGNRRAVALALLHAVPPADRLARGISERVVDDTNLEGLSFSSPDLPMERGDTLVRIDGTPMLVARPVVPLQGEMRLHLEEHARARVGFLLALAVIAFIVTAWRFARTLSWRFGAIAVALGCAAVVPLAQYSNVSRLFDPSLFFTPIGGPLTANAAALGITSALLLLGVLAVFRGRERPRRFTGVAIVLVVAGLGPFLLRDLARGIRIPPYGPSGALWMIWQIPLFLAAVSVLLAGTAAGGVALGRRRGLSPAVAPMIAAFAAVLAPAMWQAEGGWPWWYTVLWVVAIGALAFSKRARAVVVSAALVAALGAATLVWANTVRGRVNLARQDLAGLGAPDQEAMALLGRFIRSLAGEPTAPSRTALLQRFVTSDLAAAGYPVQLASWVGPDSVIAVLQTAPFALEREGVSQLAVEASAEGRPVVRAVEGAPATLLAAAVPASDGGVTTVIVAPRTRLVAPDPFAQLTGLSARPAGDQPYTLALGDPPPRGPAPPPRERWRREGSQLYGDFPVATSSGAARAHATIELRPLSALVQRGALIVLIDLLLVGALWMINVLADGRMGPWLRARHRSWRRSYRLRLSLALFAFFVLPAAVFAIWSYQQLITDAARARVLLVAEALRGVTPPDTSADWLARESARLDAPLLFYREGELVAASDPLFESLAPVGRLLPASVEQALGPGEELTASRIERIGESSIVFGYRLVQAGAGITDVVAAPARSADVALDRRRNDLAILVLFATAVGALAALWLSGVAARQLARPIRALRQAALAIAAGEREPPLHDEPTVEFQPVFNAFRRMAADLGASRAALEAAQRRTATVLRNVASGVVAIDEAGTVTVANAAAEALWGAPLPPGTPLRAADPFDLADRAARFAASDREEEELELDLGEQQLRVRLGRLGSDGVLITVDDVSALARAQRVLAWGEMARQVAHEIKNPLTPIRLGVQHLRRARHDGRVDFDAVLDQNVTRILAEIDRLDEIARAFSRYGAAPGQRPGAEPVDVARVVRDVMALETMGEGDVTFRAEGADAPRLAMAREQELREVLLNVLENARLANATRVTATLGADAEGRVELRVRDDGSGIPSDVLPRIFEPHFSTRTSGSGLGLAVSRQMIEAWGGEIAITSIVGEGTEVIVRLSAA
ncbi:MAG: sensor histidine kinase [Gemmatimonadaceae bacterium]